MDILCWMYYPVSAGTCMKGKNKIVVINVLKFVEVIYLNIVFKRELRSNDEKLLKSTLQQLNE